MLTQRLGSKNQKDIEFIGDLISAITRHKGCCDEVWLASDYGFPTLEVHRKSADVLKDVAKKFRDENIRVSLQISNTIGHGQYISSIDCSGLIYDGSPVEKMVGADGTTADYCFCWNGENFRKYTLDSIKFYSEIQPYCVWIDDDFRASNHSPVEIGCFCDDCMKKFNSRYNSGFTRESLVHEINFGDILWRKNYVSFMRENLGELMYLISTAVHEISPESRMGYQYYCNGGITGYGYDFIFDAMKKGTGLNPLSRPGGGSYNDHNPNNMLEKSMFINWQNYMLPDYVEEIRPEIENLPDVVFGKTIAGTCFETSLYLANGATAMSYAMLMEEFEPLVWHEKMLEQFGKFKPYWEQLSIASKGTAQSGLQMVTSGEEWLQQYGENDAPFLWKDECIYVYNDLRRTGIPLALGKSVNPIYILHPHYAKVISQSEAEFLLDKPVVTDGKSIEILTSRGFKFSAFSESIKTEQLFERFTEHKINDGFSGKNWSQSFFFSNGHRLIPNGECEVFGAYGSNSLNFPKTDDKDFEYGIANAIIKTEYGTKWAVFGHSPWNNVISTDKRNQILHAADYISKNRLPAILETPQQAVLLPRENSVGETTSVSIVNCTIGESDVLTLRIRRPAGENFAFMSDHHDKINLPFAIKDDDYIVHIPALSPWSVGTVFIESGTNS